MNGKQWTGSGALRAVLSWGGAGALCCAGAVALAQGAASPSQDFVTRAAQAGMAEVKLSQLAKSRGENPAVRGYADNMIADHEKAQAELEALAGQKKLKVPTDLDATHQTAMKNLSAKSGTDFDTAYMMIMRQDHDKAVSLFKTAAESPALDADLKAFAAKTLPTLEMHDEMARKLPMGPNGMMMKKAPPAGGTPH